VLPRVLVPGAAEQLRAAHAVTAWHVLAVGKAAAGMYEAFAAAPPAAITRALVIGPVRPPEWDDAVPFVQGGHPVATRHSLEGALRALELAADVPPDGGLVCLLSGGASALMAAPMDGVTLEAKQRAVLQVMNSGGDITALNAVRKHLSRVKGGRLAAACRGVVHTLAISDVIGDDLSVIGSGPCVADASTWRDAAEAVDRFGGRQGLDPLVHAAIEAGCRGEVADTPKPGDPRLSRAIAEVIGGRRQAMAGARRTAEALGYAPIVIERPIVGEARQAAHSWWAEHASPLGQASGPYALISSGETTVHVRGTGRGGRNQEFAAALVTSLAAHADAPVLVSLGTDGIDGPTDAAGAVVDGTSAARAISAGLSVESALDANDTYAFFAPLGDLVRRGPSGTNVGDLQVLLIGRA
jgi:glycerate 2-kinase